MSFTPCQPVGLATKIIPPFCRSQERDLPLNTKQLASRRPFPSLYLLPSARRSRPAWCTMSSSPQLEVYQLVKRCLSRLSSSNHTHNPLHQWGEQEMVKTTYSPHQFFWTFSTYEASRNWMCVCARVRVFFLLLLNCFIQVWENLYPFA